jgi:CRP-like cAMP-binding protein
MTVAVEGEIALRAGTAGVTAAQVGQLLAMAREVEFRPGEALCIAGAPTAHVYVVLEGELDGAAGPILGLLDALMARRCTRTVSAATAVRALEVHVDDYLGFLEDDVELCQAMIADLAASLHRATLALPDPAAALRGVAEPPTAPLADEPTIVDRVLLLRRVPAFRRASVQALVELAARARTARLGAGEPLFAEGDRSEMVWMVARGRVHLSRRARAPADPAWSRAGTGLVVDRGPAELVSHLAELTVGPREFTAVAASAALVLGVHREDLLDRLDEDFELARSILAFLASERERIEALGAV